MEESIIHAWLNDQKRAKLLQPTQFNENAQSIFTLMLHTKEKTKELPSTLTVTKVESYGAVLEVWTVKKTNGELVEYHLENIGTKFRLRNLDAERELGDKPLEMIFGSTNKLRE